MMMILEVQEGADIAIMPDELKAIIASVKGEFAEGIMIGTKPLLGMQLLFINVDASKDDVEELTNNDIFDEDGKQIAFDLGWSVLAVENEIVDQSLLLPYFVDVPVFEFDEDGEYVQTGTEPVTDLTGKLQVWAGKQWVY
tara:strand:+ start:75 stop:494 length:420 start_codon:yes stop_codon:yes gene_type:complete